MTFAFGQGLPIIDDGNSHNFFCALRLSVDGQEINQQKLFPQSARTKCVKPLTSRRNNLDEGLAKWNELFIFEVSRKVLVILVLHPSFCIFYPPTSFNSYILY